MEPDRLNHLLDHATGASASTAPAGRRFSVVAGLACPSHLATWWTGVPARSQVQAA